MRSLVSNRFDYLPISTYRILSRRRVVLKAGVVVVLEKPSGDFLVAEAPS